ncbi:MAG TPA: hypothetical protein VFL16_10860 [Steroidobacteraceae bacterium]|nr:hypothetical protein [Steroidobacteraceae bacterium]
MLSRARLLAGLSLFIALVCGPAWAATFNGRVFEDVNYGGGAGRPFGTPGTVGIGGVRVEIYNASTNAYITAVNTSTAAATLGTFTYSNASSTPLRFRVVNGSVRSTRANGSTCNTCVPVQTFRMTGSGNSVVAATDHVGGEAPQYPDAISNTTNAAYNSVATASTRIQSVTTVTPSGNNATINGIDFGFNFDTVVNVNDPATCTTTNVSYNCQGSLKQFLVNANALGNEAGLVQSGNGQIDGSTTSLPAGYESSIFMIADGSSAAGLNTGYTNLLTGGVAVISLNGALTVTGANTRLDATTQTVNVGNDNPGMQGSGGTVGVDGIALPLIQEPEVQLTSGDRVVTLSGNGSAIHGFALQQGYILLSGTGCTARNNLVGMTASGVSSAASGAAYGITFTGSSSIVRNNFVTVNNSAIRTDSGGTGSQILYNEVARPSSGHTNTFDGILLVGTISSITVQYNLARDQQGGGIEVGHGGGAPATNILVDNNTVQGNGFTAVGGPSASTEPIGIDAYGVTGSSVVFSRNVVRNNAGPGILVRTSSGITITQNSFGSNGGLSIDLDAGTGDPNTMGAPEGPTLNDSGDVDTGPNGFLNYPVIATATLVNGELSFAGFARPGSSMELYVAQADPSGFGEGLTYLGTFVEGSAADLDVATGSYGPAAINGIAQGQDNTNRFAYRVAAPGGVAIGTRLTSTATLGGATSEFDGTVAVTAGPQLVVAKAVTSYSDPVNNTTNPKSIPGGVKLYTLTVTNQGSGPVDTNSVAIADPIPANTCLYVNDINGAGSGPVQFVNGSPSSALTWTFAALNSATDDVDFSNDNGATWTYVPTAGANGCDAAVTHIRMRPKGTMPGQGSGSPNFQLRFRVVVN